jgi:hypothetical protein
LSQFNEWIARLPQLFGGAGVEGDSYDEWGKLRDSHQIKLEQYYELWRNKIKLAASSNRLLSNGWAFSTLSGLAAFEAFVRTDKKISTIYRDRSGEIGRTLHSIRALLPRGRPIGGIGGIVLYGYGNLLRETHFIEQAITSKLLKSQRVYLLDCSLFYDIFAKSPLNPLRSVLKNRQIRPLMVDLFDETPNRKKLTNIRNDLNPTCPVLHLFLGNTFCNNDANQIRGVLDATVREGDFVVAEYSPYPAAFFLDVTLDYVADMAQRAASDLFALELTEIKVRNVALSCESKATELELTERDTRKKIVFRSMLRRKFQPAELTNGNYRIISTASLAGGSLTIEAFLRLA